MIDSLAMVKTPAAARAVFRAALWRVPTKEKKLYLTFDDGPIPDVTSWVLDVLQSYHAKATFFCIGKNIDAYSDIFNQIVHEGHRIGNHTYDHHNGWKTPRTTYLENVSQCQQCIQLHVGNHTVESKPLFRPPYGKLTFAQYNYLKHHYQIVMWDVLSFDFDIKVTCESTLGNVLHHARPGSIIVFHDSVKAVSRMQYALPKVLAHFTDLGYRFEALG